MKTVRLLLLFLAVLIPSIAYCAETRNWIPSDAATAPTAWYKADAGVIVNGASVWRWEDQSGNSNHLTQVTTALQPILAHDVNNKPTIRFDGAQAIQGTFGALTQPFTIAVVAKSDNASPAADSWIFDGNDSTNDTQFGVETGGAWEINSGTAQTGGASDTNWNIHIIEVEDDTLGLHWVGGELNNTAPLGANVLDGLTVGSLSSMAANFFDGSVSEIVIYDARLTEMDRNALGYYLQSRYSGATTTLAWDTNSLNPHDSGMSLLAWYHADETRTDLDTAGTTWSDSSGNAEDLAEVTNPPGYNAAGIGGRQSIDCDGTNDLLTNATWAAGTISQPITYVAVVHADVAALGKFITGNNNSSNRPFIDVNSTNYQIFAGAFLSEAVDYTETDFIAMAVYNTTSSASYSNGGAAGASGDAGSHGLIGLRVCASFNAGAFFDGDVSEIMIFDKALSTTELNSIGAYLENRYGITFTPIP